MSTLTKGELISEARILAKEIRADNNLTNKFLWSLIGKHIAWLLERESNKRQIHGYSYLFQTYKCVDVEEAPAIDDCCGIKSKCTVWRTCVKLPIMFEDGNGAIIKSVFSIDGSTEFTKITVQDYMRKLEDPNSKYDNARYFYYNNGYLYFPIIDKNRIRTAARRVMVKALYKDKVFSACCGEDRPACLSKLEEDSFIPPKLRAELMDYVKKDLLTYKQIIPDTNIDKNENNKQ